MHDLSILRDLVVLVAVAIPVVLITQRLHVPNVVGFLVTGMVIGPHALHLIPARESVAGLAELGVVLLLFAIGLELSLTRIIRSGRFLLQGGGLQVAGTLAVVAVGATAFGIDWRQAVFLGALVALSSTAVVLKIYRDRGELDAPQGRVVVAILLFQDLCVVPFMLLTPLLGNADVATSEAVRTIGVSLAAVTALVLAGRIIVPRLLGRIAVLANREIFTLTIVFLGLGAAYLASRFGLSLALGAFIAGLVISESEYGLQALSDVLPFRDTFSGIFFISVGMLLDFGFLASNFALIGPIALAAIVLKAMVGTLATRSIGRSAGVSIVVGLSIAQIGEFSFILAEVGRPFELLTPRGYQVFLGASILTMLATPFLIAGASPFARWIGARLRTPIWLGAKPEVVELDDHVIIVGYGVNGRNLARVLRAAGIRYVILDQDVQVVRQARMDREPIRFGDGTRPEVLHRVGVERARVVVFAISAPADEGRGVVVARRLNPTVRIVVRTRYVSATEDLTRHGADEVVPEEFETSIEIFARVLRLYGVPRNVVQREVEAVRGDHYEMLRGLSMPDLRLDALSHLGVHGALDTVLVEAGAEAVGKDSVSLRLRRDTGATVIAVVRDGVALYTPDPEFRFRVGDTAVLVGDRPSLERGAVLFRAAAGEEELPGPEADPS